VEEVTRAIRICSFVVVIVEVAASVMYFLDIVEMIAILICSYLAYFLHRIDNLNYHCSSSIVCSSLVLDPTIFVRVLKVIAS
jgi:hypothetical protein